MLKRLSIWSTVQRLPGIEALLAIKGLYLFQPLIFSDVHGVAGVPLALPIVNHLADPLAVEDGAASKTVLNVHMVNCTRVVQ